MQISYDYYRTFYYVAKLQSFTKAALALGGNQPNITRTIKNLEHTLGCTLFSRSNRRAELTPEGEKLFAHVSVAFEHLEAAEKEIALDRSLQSGIVTVSASESALHCFLLPILRNYRQQYPGVHIQVITDSTPGAISALRNGLADLSLVSTPMPGISGLKETDIKTFRDVAICGDAFAFLCGKTLSLQELARYPVISLEKNTMSYRLYSELFADAGVPFSPSVEVAAADQIVPMAAYDLGIGFVPEPFLKGAEHIHLLTLEKPLPERKICMLKRKGYPLSIAATELEHLITKSPSNPW